MNRKYLLVSFIVCVLIAFLSLFFLPGEEYRWGIAIIAVFVSFTAGIFLQAVLKKGNKKYIRLVRYVLAGLFALSVVTYIMAWNNIVCKRTIQEFKNEKFVPVKKNIITGTELIDKTDPVINKLNTGKQRCSICDELNENDPEKIWLPDSVRSSKYKLYSAFLFLVVLASVLLVYLAAELLLNTPMVNEDIVFVSYNHGDQETAKKLCRALQQEDIPLIVDARDTANGRNVENMVAGDNIVRFIKRSVVRSRVTLMIVSGNSLLSGWVGIETINTFFLESFDEKKSFIACYVDNSFMNPDFPRQAYDQIDKKLESIDGEIADRIKKKINTRDLNDQKSRLLQLRGDLDQTIQRLQNSLCVEITNGKLQQNLETIVSSIRLKFQSES